MTSAVAGAFFRGFWDMGTVAGFKDRWTGYCRLLNLRSWAGPENGFTGHSTHEYAMLPIPT